MLSFSLFVDRILDLLLHALLFLESPLLSQVTGIDSSLGRWFRLRLGPHNPTVSLRSNQAAMVLNKIFSVAWTTSSQKERRHVRLQYYSMV